MYGTPSTSRQNGCSSRALAARALRLAKHAAVGVMALGGGAGRRAAGRVQALTAGRTWDLAPATLAPSPTRVSQLLDESACTCLARPFYEAPPIEVGVEQEFNGIDRRGAQAILTPHLGEVAVSEPSWLGWLGHADVVQKGAAFAHWRAVYDATLSGLRSFELVSPPMRYEQAGAAALATRLLVAHGATTDSMGALHVHVNHTSLAPAAVTQLLLVMDTQQELITRLSHSSPRQVQYFCRPWAPAFADTLRARPPQSKDAIVQSMLDTMHLPHPPMTYAADAARYHLINLQYLQSGSTLEFRQYDATEDPALVQAFVDLSLALTTAARDRDLGCLTQHPWSAASADDAALFLDTIGLHGPRLATSRKTLLQQVALPPRGFEFAEYELVRAAADVFMAQAAALVLWGPWRLPMWAAPHAEPHMLAQGAAAMARVGALAGETFGWTSYDTTFAMRSFTMFVVPWIQAAHVAAGVMSVAKRVMRRQPG